MVQARDPNPSDRRLRSARMDHSSSVSDLDSCVASSCAISSLAMKSYSRTLPTFLMLQLLRAFAIRLSLISSTRHASMFCGVGSHASFMTSSKPSRRTQNASKWNLGVAHGSVRSCKRSEAWSKEFEDSIRNGDRRIPLATALLQTPGPFSPWSAGGAHYSKCITCRERIAPQCP